MANITVLIYNAYEALVQARDNKNISIEEAVDEAIGWLGQALEERRTIPSSYKLCTNDIFKLYESFKDSGFSENQAFGMAKAYVRQSMFENILGQNSKKQREIDKLTRDSEILRSFMKNDEIIKKFVTGEKRDEMVEKDS